MPHNQIKNRDIENQIKDDLGLAEMWDTVPREYGSKILPVYPVNRDKQFDIRVNVSNLANAVITVPTNEVWEIINVCATLTTTATVGSRELRMVVATAGGDIVAQSSQDGSLSASLVRSYNYSPTCSTTDSPVSGNTSYSWFVPFLDGGFTITIDDRAGIDEANDSVALVFFYRRHRRVTVT